MPSSFIISYNYNEKSNTLKITFVTGMVYAYLKVPNKISEMLKASSSKGEYFNYHIKDKFKFKKLED